MSSLDSPRFSHRVLPTKFEKSKQFPLGEVTLWKEKNKKNKNQLGLFLSGLQNLECPLLCDICVYNFISR